MTSEAVGVMSEAVGVTSEAVGVTSAAEWARRRRRVEEACRRWAVPGGVAEVYTHAPSRSLYCAVPKAGCTFWKQVFLAANDHAEVTLV